MSAMKWISKGLKNLGMGGSSGGSSVPPALQSRLAGTHAAVTVPPKPKRPVSAYFRFLGEMRPEVLKKNPSLKVTEVAKIVGQRWSQLDEKTKEQYSESFRNELKTYQTVLEKYMKSLTPAQKEAQEQVKLDKELRQEKIEKKRRLTELGKPKKPSSAFVRFLQGKVPPGSSMKEHTETAKEFGPIWKEMTDAEKAPFTKTYLKDLEVYEKNLRKWEDEMIKLGHDDLVRVNQAKLRLATSGHTLKANKK